MSNSWGANVARVPWAAGQNYIAGDLCTSGGALYICILGHINFVPPNITYWATFGTSAPEKGGVLWSTGATYVIGDMVALGGVVYVCILGHTAHSPPDLTYWLVVGPSAGAGAQGIAVLDFGAFVAQGMQDITRHPSTHAQVAVIGQAGIVAGSIIHAWLRAEPAGTAEHSMDEHLIETIDVKAGNIIAATGFTIYAESLVGGTWGTFSVNWKWS